MRAKTYSGARSSGTSARRPASIDPCSAPGRERASRRGIVPCNLGACRCGLPELAHSPGHDMRLLDETAHDLRFATRVFKRSPGFTLVAFVTLVVGIATVTSVFSYLDAIYFARLPYKDADRIVALNERRPKGFVSYSALSLDAIRLIQGAHRSFESTS